MTSARSIYHSSPGSAVRTAQEDPCFQALLHQTQTRPPQTAFVFGSGLGGITERIQPTHAVSFARLPALAQTRIDGHQGELILGDWSGRRVLAYSGRLHFYEGHAWERVLAPVQLAARLGVKTLVLTNAAGGIREDLTPGRLMALRAHLDWTRPHPGLVRAPLARPYSQPLLLLLSRAASELDIELTEGAYAAVLGPNYETPSEIRALRSMGADAVGMSTAREIEAAASMGLACAAVSCITNRAAGLSDTRLTHEEVLMNSRKQAARLGDLLERFLIDSQRAGHF